MGTPVLEAIKHIVGDTLGLGERSERLTASTRLLGHLPELDSFAVLQLAMAIEREFDLTIPDEDFGGELFETIGSLVVYVEAHRGAALPATA
ncbi:acyl carrier protein [Devosia sp. YIM 151766]|uniref:acyl carrier protein n=1 Tax=Devosia sp. YIM 151766 TaxID=3017325 RepID=UPI00255C537B|nr:acyl carrier protein [Devosia sp. YIM 151766]WIY54221.1 acyl carrier protein [Devosia sp. YIM 151766]